MKQVSLYRISTLYKQTICEQVLSCWVVMIIPIPLPQRQHTFCQRRRFDQDCPGHRQVEMNKMNLISFCSFRPDDDQGNPGRNVVSDKKCAGAEGEELVLDYL